MKNLFQTEHRIAAVHSIAALHAGGRILHTGRVVWGKRRTEKVPGKDNEYRLVKQDEYILSEVISHEAFVSLTR